jgi:hypothetical protein
MVLAQNMHEFVVRLHLGEDSFQKSNQARSFLAKNTHTFCQIKKSLDT